MLKRFLTSREEELLKTERRQLTALRAPLSSLDASADDLAILDRSLLQLDELFLLVIVGEFNSGKTAFINALLGERFLPEGVTPTTAAIHIIRYGDEARLTPGAATPYGAGDRDIVVVNYPVEWLRDINIVDTPGTNAIIRKHEEITSEFVPRADLVLFVTSADRPFTESERLFITRIRDWGKKVVFVVNKIDIHEDEDVEQVMGFVRENARALLGREPIVFGVSSRQARQAKNSMDADERTRLWAQSRFEGLERYILDTLDEQERLRLKLANPLGVAQKLVEKYLQVAVVRRELLKEDIQTVRTIEAQLGAYEGDMRREFKYHLSHVDNVLYGMAQRGDNFFDETIRIQRILDLMNADRIRGMFEREVVADTPLQVETQTRDLIDWMVDQDYRQWQAVTDYLNKRIARHDNEIVGQMGAFETNRQQLIESVGRTAREVVATYDHAAEARELGDSVQRAVAQTALVAVGGGGRGALLVHVLALTVAEVTGVLFASGVAALGFYIIPNKRRRAKLDLQDKINDLRRRLAGALTEQFEAELTRSLTNIRAAMRPYTRFVETQQTSLGE
ncbi:MAG: dynamin family protein, partial [Nitrososphaerales archaeon]